MVVLPAVDHELGGRVGLLLDSPSPGGAALLPELLALPVDGVPLGVGVDIQEVLVVSEVGCALSDQELSNVHLDRCSW